MSDTKTTGVAEATPDEELRQQLLSQRVAKNEREWWAAGAIEKLERELNAANQRIKQLEDARTVAAANSLANMLAYEDAVAKIKRLEELGNKLRECASQLGWTSSEDPRWIQIAEAVVKAWDKEAKP